jgi:hypothetical protein
MNNFICNVPESLAQAHKLKKENKIGEAIALLEEINSKVENRNVVRTLGVFLMDTLNYQRVVELPHIQKYDPKNYAIAKSFLEGDIYSEPPICLEGHQVLENAALVCMIKDEEDIILFNLLWHYELGFRKFFIINNLSTDHTQASIKLFERLYDDTQVFILHDPIVAHYQGKKITGACRFAMTIWTELEWLVLTDADEFLCPLQPLHSLFASIPKTIDAIIVPKSFYNIVPGEPTEDDDFFFRRIQHRTHVNHVSSKAIMRANLQLTVSQGNHHIFDQENAEIRNYHCNLNLTFREFRIRSYLHHKRKVTNGGKAVEAAKQQGFMQVGGSHWEAVYNLYQQQGEAGLRRHLENTISKTASQTTILDPLPLDQIINKLEPRKKNRLLRQIRANSSS